MTAALQSLTSPEGPLLQVQAVPLTGLTEFSMYNAICSMHCAHLYLYGVLPWRTGPAQLTFVYCTAAVLHVSLC